MSRLHELLTGLSMVSKVKPAHWSITSKYMTVIPAMLSRRKSDRSFAICLQTCRCLYNMYGTYTKLTEVHHAFAHITWKI